MANSEAKKEKNSRIDSVSEFNLHNDENGDNEKKESVWQWWWQIIKTLPAVIIIVLVVRTWISTPFIVSGASMAPTFSSWDYLIVDIFTYKFMREPERGEVVVFKPPVNEKTYYIKRIVALPNETVEINDGKVTIYNKKYPEGFALREDYIDPSRRSFRNMRVKLGPSEYFVMGDNRAGSSDSRIWGPITRDEIVGRAFLRLFPFNKIDFLPGDLKR